jgi:hypothetical protein
MLIGKVTERHIRSVRARKWGGREESLGEQCCLKILHRYSPRKTQKRTQRTSFKKMARFVFGSYHCTIGSRKVNGIKQRTYSFKQILNMNAYLLKYDLS